MNPLAELKQKLMIKPAVQERERVAVVIKGEKKPRRQVKIRDTIEIMGEEQEAELEKQEIEKEGKLVMPEPAEIGEQKEVEQEQEVEERETRRPIIVDETEKGYDRAALLQKLAEAKRSKVTVKPTVAIVEQKVVEPLPLPPLKKIKKLNISKPIIIDDDDSSAEEFIIPSKKPEKIAPEKIVEEEVIKVKKPSKKTERITKKPEKGVAILGPETLVEIGDTDLRKRLPKKEPPINIKVGSYIMDNREIFVNFINSLFEPYKREIESNEESISCDNIGQTSSEFSLLTHQKIVRDYLNLYTPYRGLLLYHGLGSGKTCTSIAIAEGMKDAKRVIIMTPASLRPNYIEELKKCGDLLYKRKQFWEWISIDTNPDALEPMSAILNLPMEYIRRHRGAYFINFKKPSNYDDLTDVNKRVLEDQLNEMIKQKYTFINYNGLREKRFAEMTADYTKNVFDNAVVIIDEAHNLISRIVNKLKNEKVVTENERGEKERMPYSLSGKIYEMLLSAKNARIVLLSGTPVINYPNEFGILFNILRGYIKTWKIPLNVKTTKKIDKEALQEMLLGEKTMDYLDYSPASKILTITRNPFGFKNKIKKESGYQGVSNSKKNEKGQLELDIEFISDDEFERKIINILKRNDIDVVADGIRIRYKKALPDRLDEFMARYINETDGKLKNLDSLKRRILGLSSYFKSAQENLLPKYNKQLGVDYHVVHVPMSDFQFKIYENARQEERKESKKKRKPAVAEVFKEDDKSSYRIFSRLACNFVIPNRPRPFYDSEKKDKEGEKDGDKGDKKEKEEPEVGLTNLLNKKLRQMDDISNTREGEIEGDELLDELGGITYKESLEKMLKDMATNGDVFLSPEGLSMYSPKFLTILENIQDPEYQGLHLLYSQFRTAEGIGLFSLVLEHNGFARFRIKKNSFGVWEIDIPLEDEGKPTYALYTGTETVEEKEMLRHIYNGEWESDYIPESIGSVLRAKYRNNNMGEVIKVFMITSSGSEGINLRNTRYVHIMDPYWHPVRTEQVIGRARRICSHKALPKALQTVEVFIYLMVFTKEQLESDESIELKQKDLSVSTPKVPITTDQYLFEISEIKANVTAQLTDAVKESAFDCYIYSNGKCVNFGDPTIDKFAYVPDYADQQNDMTVRANKVQIEWVGKPLKINGVEYVYRRMSKTLLNIYDKKSYEQALEDSSIVPLQIGTLEKNEKGEDVFKQLVTK